MLTSMGLYMALTWLYILRGKNFLYLTLDWAHSVFGGTQLDFRVSKWEVLEKGAFGDSFSKIRLFSDK